MKIKLLLFDLGRVLADLGSPTTRMRLKMSDEEFWELWLSLPIVQLFESGDISPDDFLRDLARELGVSSEPDSIRRRFLDWRPRLFPDADRLVSHLSTKSELALLSNTNTLHWNLLHDENAAFQYFKHLFLSFELRCCKPDNFVFEYVLDKVSTSPSEILFLDDMEQNVDAARKFGIRAVQVHGIDEVRSALSYVGLDTA